MSNLSISPKRKKHKSFSFSFSPSKQQRQETQKERKKESTKMVREEPKQSPQDQKQTKPVESVESLFSPRFKSVAAMAGWDEESIIIASLIVEDTPDRDFNHKKRSDLHFKSPPSTNSRRKRRVHRRSPISIPVSVFNLDEEEPNKQESERKKAEPEVVVVDQENKVEGNELSKEDSGVSCSNSILPCMDKLREELSCAICLEICFEPSTTSCGHSFCKKCLCSAADKCGKRCPKCRQLISNGRSCTVNTVLWNTIQILFPQEVEARKAAGALNNREAVHQSPERRINTVLRTRGSRSSRLLNRDVSRERASSQDEDSVFAQRSQREDLSRQSSRDASRRRRRGTPNQDEDAALALRLQREEFMEAFRGTHEQSGSSLSLARANLRAMASRAINIRMRGRPI